MRFVLAMFKSKHLNEELKTKTRRMANLLSSRARSLCREFRKNRSREGQGDGRVNARA